MDIKGLITIIPLILWIALGFFVYIFMYRVTISKDVNKLMDLYEKYNIKSKSVENKIEKENHGL